MQKNRLEAFSDGVFAIIITIMVLELKVPHEATIQALVEMAPTLFSYILSFVYIAIYWNNHHHLLHSTNKINGSILWANNHLLFWLSLVPFVTAWSGQTSFQSIPVALYGIILFMASVAYYILSLTIISITGQDSILAKAVGNDYKGKLSVVAYLLSVPLAFWNPLMALAIFIGVAIVWLIPDQRIEKVLQK